VKNEIAEIPGVPTMMETASLKRIATRYSEIEREHAYLVGLMNLAVRTGDTNLLATAKRRLAEMELQRSECFSGLGGIGQEILSADVRSGEGNVAA
jgi:hypothetical protein